MSLFLYLVLIWLAPGVLLLPVLIWAAWRGNNNLMTENASELVSPVTRPEAVPATGLPDDMYRLDGPSPWSWNDNSTYSEPSSPQIDVISSRASNVTV